jgi:hypothetical protein
MASINIKAEGSLLIISVTGDLTVDELKAVFKEYYPSEIVKDIIWEFSNALTQLNSHEDLVVISTATKEALGNWSRQGGKTVFVGKSSVEYGLLCKYTAMAQLTGIPIEYHVVRTMEEARSCIKQGKLTGFLKLSETLPS